MIKITENPTSKKILVRLRILPFIYKKTLHDALYAIGKSHIRYVHSLMKQPKTGEYYKIKGVLHRASAPGEAPAILSGTLYESVDYKVKGSSELEFGYNLPQGLAPYGEYLEEGTNKIKPRPHLSKAVKDKEKETEETILKYIKRTTFGGFFK